MMLAGLRVSPAGLKATWTGRAYLTRALSGSGLLAGGGRGSLGWAERGLEWTNEGGGTVCPG